ncbi:hypothetical protein [Streptomyces sp. NPDC092952]|uniref:hypothetical protein n=1 Tax=Streptomyces sp. NPDC092952 TaxID=3366018 RepID=UPI003821BA18
MIQVWLSREVAIREFHDPLPAGGDWILTDKRHALSAVIGQELRFDFFAVIPSRTLISRIYGDEAGGGVGMAEAFDVLEVATSGAGVLAAEMARSGWQGVRDALVAFFRGGNEGTAPDELRVVDLHHARLLETPEAERERVREEICQELVMQLRSFLAKYPGTAVDLMALVRERQRANGEGSSGPRMTAENNKNSQVIMTGQSIFGGSFTYRAEEPK